MINRINCFMKYLLSVFVCVLFLSEILFGQNNMVRLGETVTHIHYVKTGALSGNGKSWNTAFNNLQSALDVALPDDEIWVAAGTYLPTESYEQNECSKAFILQTGNVKIYGGFPATGNPTMDDRNRSVYETILSGDIDNNDKPDGEIIGNNSYHVVINTATDVLLDGFTISGGNACHSSEITYKGCQINNLHGGGVLNVASSKLVLKNSIVKANVASYGAGIANDTSPSEFVNVLICGNYSKVLGAGMYNNGADPVLTNVTISGNSDGMYSEYSSPKLFNTIVTRNNVDNFNFGNNTQTNFNHCLIGGLFYRNNDGTGPEITGIPLNEIFMDWGGSTYPSKWDNYRLAANSFAKDAGNNDYINESTDLYGNPRIMNGIVDLGAGEFHFMTFIDVTVNGLPTDCDANDLKIHFYNTAGVLVENLQPGEYRMSVSYPGFIMTYYKKDGTQASTWKDATPIIVEPANNADQHIPIVVTLTQEPNMEHGTITISGTLGFADDDIHGLSKIRPVSNLNGNVSLSSASAVKSDEYELVKTIQTTDGHYSFTDLPEGYYRIVADIPGYESGAVDIHVVEGMETVNFIVKTDTKTITAEPSTLTEAPSWQTKNVKVYPNPATDVLHVTGLEGNYTVKIINILGQLVYSTTGSSPELLLNIGHLPSGMYFLRIESNQKATTCKIIKQ